MSKTVAYSRRELSRLLPALAAVSAAAQQGNQVLPSRAFRYDDLPVKANKTNRSRAVLRGETHSNFPVELHQTELDPGQAPHAPHRHIHEEVFLLREGTVDMIINGKTTRLGPGAVAYVASNDLHGLVNSGAEAARYFVIALGNDRT